MIGIELGRREFLRAAGQTCALLLGGAAAPVPAAARAEPLRLGVVLPADAHSAGRGVMLGAEEAGRTGALVGRTVEVRRWPSADAALGERRSVAAVIGGVGEGSARELAEMAEDAGVLFLNIGAREDVLRGCGAGVFHVEASESMYAAALAAGGATAAAIWHPSLERFGAAQLGDRFRARFGTGMDGAAWAGWMAVKVLWEASLRTRTGDADSIGRYLARETTQFDGHKGWPLSFRSWDHQLRQPLYLLSGDEVVGEVPAGRSEGASARELLDRLGTGPAGAPCPPPMGR